MFRPFTDIEDIPLVFFREEELEGLEFDHETVPSDQYECSIAAISTEAIQATGIVIVTAYGILMASYLVAIMHPVPKNPTRSFGGTSTM
jgi:hypothetical protein